MTQVNPLERSAMVFTAVEQMHLESGNFASLRSPLNVDRELRRQSNGIAPRSRSTPPSGIPTAARKHIVGHTVDPGTSADGTGECI